MPAEKSPFTIMLLVAPCPFAVSVKVVVLETYTSVLSENGSDMPAEGSQYTLLKAPLTEPVKVTFWPGAQMVMSLPAFTTKGLKGGFSANTLDKQNNNKILMHKALLITGKSLGDRSHSLNKDWPNVRKNNR